MKQKIKNRKLFKVTAILLLMVMWVAAPFILNGDKTQAEELILSDTRHYASLSGAPINGVTPAGFAEYRIDDDNRRRLKVQISSVNLGSGTTVGVFVSNNFVGQVNLDGFGNAYLDLDTNDGQNVPFINIGNPIEIRQNTTVVLNGVFGTVNPTPSPSGSPSASPSVSPSASPSVSPSPSPSVSPTVSPSVSPTVSPSVSPSPNPSPSVSPSPSAGGNAFAGLTGPTFNGSLPQGFAQYEIHSSRRELEVRVYQVNLSGNTALTVEVDNAFVGNLILENGGEGRLRLRTDNGQNVPNVVNGSIIIVRNAGLAILSGIFSTVANPSPSPSASVSPSPSASPSVSPSGSPTASPSPSGSPSPSPSASPALGRYFETKPTGNQLEVPVSTNANADFKVFLNVSETQATITGEFRNLSSAQTGARIETTVGTSTVIHNFGAVGGTNGNFASITVNITPAQVQQLRAGLWFAVITSADNPNGEIGGKLRQRSSGGDFDGDGSNDFAVFRPSTGVWYSQNSAGFTAQTFGSATDIPVSADYDGDGRTDSAVFKNVNGSGVFEIRNSSDGNTTATQFGFATDIPVRGDFDGDGRGDVAVFRPSTGVWYVKKSNNTGYIIVQFGSNGDKPSVADFDGDGKDDIAVFRPSTGVWYWIRSSNGSVGIVQFGLNGDVPIKGDFDGDGREDIAVWRPSTGVWYIWRSSDNSFDIRQFGLDGDIPVAGNYDGDTRTDIGIFRPSDGIWYIWRSVDNTFEYRQFGLNGDIPTIAR